MESIFRKDYSLIDEFERDATIITSSGRARTLSCGGLTGTSKLGTVLGISMNYGKRCL